MDTCFIGSYVLSLAMTGLVSQADLANMPQAEQLSPEQIARAWQDPVYRSSLTPQQKNMLPANPAGEIASSGGTRAQDPKWPPQIITFVLCTCTRAM